MRLQGRIRIKGTISCRTALHIGSGEGGEANSDMGILRDPQGEPFIPGSSLKGVFRSTAESMADLINLEACFLSEASGVSCASADQKLSKRVLKEIGSMQRDGRTKDLEEYVAGNTCDVCKLMGSPLAAGKMSFRDAGIMVWAELVEIRDGVCIDRDAGTAIKGAKYDYEVLPRGATFKFEIAVENPNGNDKALIAAVLLDWKRSFRLGGMTSRGLGEVVLTDLTIEEVDMTERDQLRDFLVTGAMTTMDEKCMEEWLEVGLGEGA